MTQVIYKFVLMSTPVTTRTIAYYADLGHLSIEWFRFGIGRDYFDSVICHSFNPSAILCFESITTSTNLVSAK